MIGDWVVAGTTGDDVDVGKIVAFDPCAQTVEVAWAWSLERTTCHLSADDVEVYTSRDKALAEAERRRSSLLNQPRRARAF